MMTTNKYNPNNKENQQLISEIEQSLNLIIQEGKVTELRAVGKGSARYTESGYFTDLRKMAEEAARITQYTNGVYFTPNPVNPDLLARCTNRTEAYPKSTTSNDDITNRQWLLIDCDPIRPADISSTNDEKEAAMMKALQIRQGLTNKGWPEPIVADSGNGAHLMYRINLPINDNELVKRVLEALSMLFSDDKVKVDTVVHNTARIWKLYGTWARKGDNTDDRPHRPARVIWEETPGEFALVSKLQLEELARIIPTKPTKKPSKRANTSQFDVEAWIIKHELDVVGPSAFKDKNGKTAKRWLFHICPWNPDHTNDSAYIIQFEDGAIAAGCFHDGCKDQNWQSLRKLYEPDYEPRKQTYALTDYGNAERLVSQHGDNIRYCPQQNKWYIWNGKYWSQDITGDIDRMAKSTVRSIYTEANSISDPDRRSSVAKWAIKSESEKRIKSMIDLAQTEPEIPVTVNDLDANYWLINCENGVIDLRSDKLLPHNRDYLLTKMIPVEWKGLDYTSDLWEKVLSDWTGGDESLRTFLQSATGYSITGDTSEEVLFFIHGPTQAGKSTFIDGIKNTLGEYTKTADFETFLKRSSTGGVRNDIARLAGSRIVISIEVEKGKKLAEGLIKTITGGDDVASRFLYKETFEFKPTFALWLVANDAPDIDADDEAIWRRILRIPFSYTVPKEKRDNKLKKILKDDPDIKSAILSWAVRGCLMWQKDGLQVPEKVRLSTEDYRKEVDPFLAFFDEVCVFEPNAWASTMNIYNAYQQWADNFGEQKLYNNRPLTDRLKKIGCSARTKREHGMSARGWQGVRIH